MEKIRTGERVEDEVAGEVADGRIPRRKLRIGDVPRARNHKYKRIVVELVEEGKPAVAVLVAVGAPHIIQLQCRRQRNPVLLHRSRNPSMD